MTNVIEHAAPATNVRWIATIHYRTETGPVDVTHDLLEIHELHDRVECGPHWDTIERIEIVRAPGAIAGLTIEGAQKL